MSSAQEHRPSYDQQTAPAPGVPVPRAADDEATPGRAEYEQYNRYEMDSTAGSTGLAGWLLILGGMWSFFTGLAMVVNAAYFRSLSGYATISHYAYQWNLSGWGWANLIFGIVVVAVGITVLMGQPWARWAGVALAVIGAVGTFLFLPLYPFWSILVIAVDVFIIWALSTARRRQDT